MKLWIFNDIRIILLYCDNGGCYFLRNRVKSFDMFESNFEGSRWGLQTKGS